jgi:hypothetical protein
MPIKTANEIWRDYVTDGVPSSGANKPVKSDIRDWAAAIEAASLAAPRIITVAGPYTVADGDVLIVINLAVAGTVALTLGAIINRNKAPLTIIDYAKTAAATITLTPNGTDEIGGLTGSSAWTMTSAGVGMGISQKFYPSIALTPAGWIVGV